MQDGEKQYSHETLMQSQAIRWSKFTATGKILDASLYEHNEAQRCLWFCALEYSWERAQPMVEEEGVMQTHSQLSVRFLSSVVVLRLAQENT